MSSLKGEILLICLCLSTFSGALDYAFEGLGVNQAAGQCYFNVSIV